MTILFFGIWLFLSEVALAEEQATPQPEDQPKPPFVDWIGAAKEIRFLETYKSYFWDREFHIKFAPEKDLTQLWEVVSRESTPYYGWRLGPTYTGLAVDWSKNPRLRVMGIRGLDRHQEKFHDIPLDRERTITVFILFVWQNGQWLEYYVNNWFHDWVDKTPGLHTQDVVKYYLDRGLPYDVYGWLPSAGPGEAWSPEMAELVRKAKGKVLYHGLIRSDAAAPLGYRLKLLHLWDGADFLFGSGEAIEVLKTLK